MRPHGPKHGIPLALALLLAACGGDAAGPGGQHLRLFIRPVFGTAAGAGIVNIARTRVRLVYADESPALDSVIVVPAGADSVTLDARVDVTEPGEVLSLTVAFITPAGDTAFYGGPVPVRTTVSSGAPVLVDLPTVYVGVGADAIGVIINQRAAFVVVGDTATVTADAYDAQQQIIPGTPIAWASLDPGFAIVADPAVGRVTGVSPGTARIVASLLTGPADTITAQVGVPASPVAAR
ncbi:MAG TPA: hypothetical protein VFH97_00690 [Gemmatimonadales bacterium]|nr:hypothetical protein [Gemmatimonadales bacterium]